MKISLSFAARLQDSLVFDAEAKASMPLGQLPVLEVDGVKFCQQLSIARFLARRFGLVGDELQVKNILDPEKSRIINSIF